MLPVAHAEFSLEPLQLIPVSIVATLYFVRARTLSHQGRPVAPWRQVSFAGGMVAGLLRNSAASAAHEFPNVWRRASRGKLRAWL